MSPIGREMLVLLIVICCTYGYHRMIRGLRTTDGLRGWWRRIVDFWFDCFPWNYAQVQLTGHSIWGWLQRRHAQGAAQPPEWEPQLGDMLYPPPGRIPPHPVSINN